MASVELRFGLKRLGSAITLACVGFACVAWAINCGSLAMMLAFSLASGAALGSAAGTLISHPYLGAMLGAPAMLGGAAGLFAPFWLEHLWQSIF